MSGARPLRRILVAQSGDAAEWPDDNVAIVGTVTGIHVSDRGLTLAVDDTSGLLECRVHEPLWRVEAPPVERGHGLPLSDAALHLLRRMVASFGRPDVKLGDVVRATSAAQHVRPSGGQACCSAIMNQATVHVLGKASDEAQSGTLHELEHWAAALAGEAARRAGRGTRKP